MGEHLEGLLREHERIMEAADGAGVTLRLFGAAGVAVHAHHGVNTSGLLRRPLKDLDYLAYGKQNRLLPELFSDLGYRTEERHMAYFGKDRHIYEHQEDGHVIDVFFDCLRMCHEVDFRGDLERDYPTAPLDLLLLAKLQIVRITENDLQDVFLLLLKHETGQQGRETLDATRIADRLASDWGFYRSCKGNLEKLEEALRSRTDLSDGQKSIVHCRLTELEETIEVRSKSRRWKARSLVGDRAKWYCEVEERVR